MIKPCYKIEYNNYYFIDKPKRIYCRSDEYYTRSIRKANKFLREHGGQMSIVLR